MNAIQFPNMIKSNKAQLITGKAATYQNLKYVLLSTKKTLLGDPYFGTQLKRLLFEKKNIIIRDLVIDEIISCINLYMPQLILTRDDIEVHTTRDEVRVRIKAKNIVDYSFEDYSIKLLSLEEL